MAGVFFSPLGTNKDVDSYDVRDGRRSPKAVPFHGSRPAEEGGP